MPRLHVIAALALTACTQATPQPDHAAQMRACAAIVGPHVGMAADTVPAAWDHLTPEGTAIVTVGPAGRVHTCEVDGRLRVLEVLHPDQ
jgi:hypothetical protein